MSSIIYSDNDRNEHINYMNNLFQTCDDMGYTVSDSMQILNLNSFESTIESFI